MEQNTQEWLEMRKNYIGASDAPIIMGDSPWKTPLQLWELKMGFAGPDPENDAMRRGKELEPQIRELYNLITGSNAKPKVMFHAEISYMMASLDGYDEEKRIPLEIKTASRKDFETAIQKRVPEKYYAQLQHQLAVSNEILLHFFVYYNEDNYVLIEVERDNKYIKKMLDKEEEFWKCVETFKAPDMTDRDFVQQTSDEWALLAGQLRDLREERSNAKKVLEEIEDREKSIKEKLISVAGNRSSKGNGIKLERKMRKGHVDYKAIPELAEIDLEKYRKPSTEMWSVKVE